MRPPGKANTLNTLQVSWDGQRCSFEQDQTVRIGRSTDNDVVVSDPTVSRQHAQLAWSPDGWVFEGLGRAGTFLRGGAVTRLVVAGPVELTLASPHGPMVRLEPSQPAGGAASPGSATSVLPADPATPVSPMPPDQGTRPEASGGFQGRPAGPRPGDAGTGPEAIGGFQGGRSPGPAGTSLDVIANYTAFQQIRVALGRAE